MTPPPVDPAAQAFAAQDVHTALAVLIIGAVAFGILRLIRAMPRCGDGTERRRT